MTETLTTTCNTADCQDAALVKYKEKGDVVYYKCAAGHIAVKDKKSREPVQHPYYPFGILP